jgi:hypothetical protein
MFRAALTLFALIAAASAAEPQLDTALFTAAQKAMPSEVTTNQLVSVLQEGVWNSNRTALAVSITQPHPKSSLVFVFLRQKDGGYLAVDARGVEGGNLGKLGTAGRAGYDRFETVPTEWLHREDGRFQVVMRTRAWKAGKRFTVSEKLLINPSGTVLWRRLDGLTRVLEASAGLRFCVIL